MRCFRKIYVTVLALMLSTPMLAACEGIGGWWNETSETEQAGTVYNSGDSTSLLNAPSGLQASPAFTVSQYPHAPAGVSPTPITPLQDAPVAVAPAAAPVPPQPVTTSVPVMTPSVEGRSPYAANNNPNPPYPAASQWQRAAQDTAHVSAPAASPAAPTLIVAPPQPVRAAMPVPVHVPVPAPQNLNTKAALAPEIRPDISRVYFGYGSATLNGANHAALNTIAETAKFAPVDRVMVEGHASSAAQSKDIVAAKIMNLKQSMDRAAAVSGALMQKGVPAEKIKTVAWGDTMPYGQGEAAQRRVDIITAAPQAAPVTAPQGQ